MIRIALPPLGNIFVGLLKGATLALDHRRPGHGLPSPSRSNLDFFTPFEPFTAVALILVVLVAVFSAITTVLERLLRLP